MKKLLILLIRFYQTTISPMIPPRCKYYPSCSAYAIEAIQVHGAWHGLMLATWRLLRCNPLSDGGLDPVPPKRA
jgi:putative membrane protein insertion efficiency factor